MKKTALVVFLSLIMLANLPAAVLALDITITPSGQIEFYQNQVLGDDEEAEDESSTETENDRGDNNSAEEQAKKLQERNREAAKKSAEQARESQKKATEKPFKSVAPSSGQVLKVTPAKEKIQVELKNKVENKNEGEFEKIEMMETERVRLKMSAEAQQQREEARTEYHQKLMEARQERAQEMLEIRNRVKEQKQALEIESRNVRARLKEGAQFEVDPTTNELTITTPSGNTHVLQHLPDQVIEKMLASGLASASDELEIKTEDDGTVKFAAKAKRQKKLLGLFNREVEMEVEIDDETGDVSATEAQPNSLFEVLLNRMSF